jgi:rhamnulokinase
MPDLLGFLLTGVRHCEFTNASTTQLMGLDNGWNQEGFDLIGWPVPTMVISMPGKVLHTKGTVSLVSVGSHDTASAVFGLGPLLENQAFLNVGTWSLLGTLLDRPLLSSQAFTNERTVDGRVRYLTNIPGFYVINRVHEELGIKESVPEWLKSAAPQGPSTSIERGWVDLTKPEFFNPSSMLKALAQGASVENWAALALNSLVETTTDQLKILSELTQRNFAEIRVSGGGSRSEAFCQALANRVNKPVVAGPEEATLLGNLAVQFLASGAFVSFDEASAAVGRSFVTRTYSPNS